MPLKITRSDEPINIETITTLIYGQPGVGKTSTAFTAKNPLLLDCDHGAHRSAFRKDSFHVESWTDIAGLTKEDIDGYDTIIVDTVGRLLDFLASDLISKNSKLGYNGALSLQGYGQLKAQFAQWIKRLKTMGKDIVLVAHDKEDKNGDSLIVRPDIQGGSYLEVFKIADSVGYIYKNGGATILDFSPCANRVGKDVANLGAITVPNFDVAPDFYKSQLTAIKTSINSLSAEGKRISDEVAAYRGELDKIETTDGMDAFLIKVNKEPDIVVQKQVKHLMNIKIQELGFTFDKETMAFVVGEKNAA